MTAELARVVDTDKSNPDVKLDLNSDIIYDHLIDFVNSIPGYEGREAHRPNLYSCIEVKDTRQVSKKWLFKEEKRTVCSVHIIGGKIIQVRGWEFEDYEEVVRLAEKISSYFGAKVSLKTSKWQLKTWLLEKEGNAVPRKLIEFAKQELQDEVPSVDFELS